MIHSRYKCSVTKDLIVSTKLEEAPLRHSTVRNMLLQALILGHTGAWDRIFEWKLWSLDDWGCTGAKKEMAGQIIIELWSLGWLGLHQS